MPTPLTIILTGLIAGALIVILQIRIFTLKRRLAVAQKETETARRLKSEFIAKVSHELKTPLNSAVGYVDLLRERKYGLITSEQDDVLRRVHDACHRLLNLIQNLLDFSGADLGRIKLDLTEFDVNAELRSTLEMFEKLAENKGVKVSATYDPEVGKCFLDRQKLHQAVANILSNSVKFTLQGEIALHAKPIGGGEFILIEVRDSGIGIPPAELPHVFEEFRQADGSIRRDYGGQGLGLSISQKFIHFMGGEIEALSEPGEGTAVRIALPRRITHPMRREAERAPALRALKESR